MLNASGAPGRLAKGDAAGRIEACDDLLTRPKEVVEQT